jgi:hypothetical protein
MIVRTSLLAACMIVVPGLALCSHHLPAEVRAAARCDIWQPVAARVQSWFSSPADPESPEPRQPRGEPPPAASAVAVASDADRAAERLAALGAVAFECRPLEDGGGVHVASCRIAMDAAGQLHRVFQAPGVGSAAATAALVAEVEAWQRRLAVRAVEPVSPPPAARP